MDDEERDQVLELDADRFISVEVEREWPKYVATWSIRRQAGETDYPVQTGRIERMPPADPAELDAMLEDLRAEAMQTARQAAGQNQEPDEKGKRESLLSRLFGRH